MGARSHSNCVRGSYFPATALAVMLFLGLTARSSATAVVFKKGPAQSSGAQAARPGTGAIDLPSPSDRQTGQKQLLTFADLGAVNSSPNQVREAFANKFGKNPDGIALNNEVRFNAVEPPITVTYGWPCHKEVGKLNRTPTNAVLNVVTVGTDTVQNDGDTEVTMKVRVTGTWEEVQEVSFSKTSGLETSMKVTLAEAFEWGITAKLETTVGDSKADKTKESRFAEVSVVVPPRSKRTVKMDAKRYTQDIPFTLPISITGRFGANFGDRVDGSYFWSLSAQEVLPKTSGTTEGKLSGQHVTETFTVVGPAVPL